MSTVTMEDILAAWRRREDNTQQAAYWWTAMESLRSPTGSPATGSGTPDFVTKPRNCELYLGQGPEIRLTRRGEFWVNMSEGRVGFFDFVYYSAFDGQIATTLYGDGYPDQAKWGFVGKAYRFQDDLNTLPLILTHRPFGGLTTHFDIRGWKTGGMRFAKDGTQCIVITEQPETTGVRPQILVDPNRDFLPIEVKRMWNDNLLDDIVIAYELSAKRLWYPKSWRITRFFPESGDIESTVTVNIDHNVFDDAVAPVSYRLEFGPGTVVQDGRHGTIEVIRLDGSRDRYLESDWEEGKLSADAFHVDAKPRSLWKSGAYLLAAIAGAAIVALIRWYRWGPQRAVRP